MSKFATLSPFDMDDMKNGCFRSLDSESADDVDSAQLFVNSNCELASCWNVTLNQIVRSCSLD